MATYQLAAVTNRAIGRCAVFYGNAFTYVAAPTGADLALTYLGDTEGEVTVEFNEEYAGLTVPEMTGGALHNRYVAGENPVVSFNLYLATAATRAIVSPTGAASGGYGRRRAVSEHSLVLIPEEVFIEANAEASLVCTNTAGTAAWTVGGDAATAAQLALLDQSVWFWRGHFEKAPMTFKHDDGGKAVQACRFQAMYNSSMPDGHRLYTVGRPDEAATPILVDAAA